MDRMDQFKVSDLVLNEDVKTCHSKTPLIEIVEMFQENNIGSVVITEANVPTGIFTERDFIKKIAGKVTNLSEPVAKYMTPDPKCVRPDSSIRLVLGIMRVGRFRHVVVTDHNKKLLNVISVKDVLNFLIDEK